jgi:hypothetical protein
MEETRDDDDAPAEAPVGGSAEHPELAEPALVIPYEPELLSDPVRFIAHTARGVAHHVVALDGDVRDEELEPLVDATTVFLGFGLFTANAAARFGSPAPIWLGELAQQPVVALSEHEVAYALALFAVLTEVPDSRVEEHLRPNPREFYRKAVKHVLRYRGRELSRLRQVPLAGIGPYR